MTFQESAARGDIVSTFQTAIVYGALWAIGSSWSTAIREIAVTVMPESSNNRILAEIGSAALTTVLGVTVAVLATLDYARCHRTPKDEPIPPVVNRANTIARR